MPDEQAYKNGQSAQYFERRKNRKEKAAREWHYPWLFGAGSLVDIMDRVTDYQGLRTRSGNRQGHPPGKERVV